MYSKKRNVRRMVSRFYYYSVLCWHGNKGREKVDEIKFWQLLACMWKFKWKCSNLLVKSLWLRIVQCERTHSIYCEVQDLVQDTFAMWKLTAMYLFVPVRFQRAPNYYEQLFFCKEIPVNDFNVKNNQTAKEPLTMNWFLWIVTAHSLPKSNAQHFEIFLGALGTERRWWPSI